MASRLSIARAGVASASGTSSSVMARRPEPGGGAPTRDVVVVGGGPGAPGAAVAGAREGADPLLVEAAPAFGRPVPTTGDSWPADLERFGLARVGWQTLRPRRPRGVVVSQASIPVADVAVPAQDASASAVQDHRPSAAGACGCKDGCHCGHRRSTRTSANPSRLLPRVIESMRRLSRSARPVRFCRPAGPPAALRDAGHPVGSRRRAGKFATTTISRPSSSASSSTLHDPDLDPLGDARIGRDGRARRLLSG